MVATRPVVQPAPSAREHAATAARNVNAQRAFTTLPTHDFSMTATPDDRLVDDIRHRLSGLQQRVAAACHRVDRDPASVRLVAVTKTFPLEVVRAGIAAGVTDFGENRVQELEEKVEGEPGQFAGGRVRWHLVGALQRNKARRAVQLADVFHALDSVRLAEELDKRAGQEHRVLPCYVQVNVSGEASKFGVTPEAAHGFLNDLGRFEHLRIEGLMTLAAPVDSDAELETVVRPQFRLLRALAETYDGGGHQNLTTPLRLSMGMSGDFEVAVQEGATDIRLGTALFGPR
jgi:PLP dependent protein